MARTKQTWTRKYEHVQPRTTWTRFHLPTEQSWPNWTKTYFGNEQLGPLSDVSGIDKVALGRMVEQPEEAVMIVRWDSEEDVKRFKETDACSQLLHDLGSDAQLLMLRDPSGIGAKGILEGRVTLTKLTIPRSAGPPDVHGMQIRRAIEFVLPEDYQELPRFLQSEWQCLFWIDEPDNEDIQCWISMHWGRFWNPNNEEWVCYRAAEEASATDPEAVESSAKQVAAIMPPVESWTQERWEIKVAEHFVQEQQEE